jgi:hypothetical protein
VIHTRDRRVNDPTYIEWQRAYQAEQDAATAAALDADPVAKAERSMDVEAQAIRQTILTGYIPESLLPGIARMNGCPIGNEKAVIQNFKFFAATNPSFKRWMGYPLLEAAERSDIAPIAPNYTALHNLMLAYSAYPDEPVQPVTQPEVTEAPMSPSDRAIVEHQNYCEEIIGHDESGKAWTMQMVDALPSKEMLRLLRLFESGHRGSNLLTTYREMLDIKQQQEAERARIAAEQEGGN